MDEQQEAATPAETRLHSGTILIPVASSRRTFARDLPIKLNGGKAKCPTMRWKKRLQPNYPVRGTMRQTYSPAC